jgi:hypothetical protein
MIASTPSRRARLKTPVSAMDVNPATLFQKAAHMEIAPVKNETCVQPAVTEQTFAELRREAEKAQSTTAQPAISFNDVRLSFFVRCLALKNKASEIGRPLLAWT